ncbi:D-alanyl-D-alanine carboxypeptidase DacF [Paraliobacillus ryukyuensis]|uniref:serine-type D-Ala-D-Ala carboxypeptidase n=1 Tax=Paraliobacillus ryukyuensis TaxID=200904 RepID=A0A366EJ23_9BACI|nr:D-alanyl-D-alanine carboxypeptidase family protein [Paraliobacillus ryukyuensis]RBP01479.1 D-Ala-D-Ala carboxypeptidase DacF [Paraliobacillus ryukyuensis]
MKKIVTLTLVLMLTFLSMQTVSANENKQEDQDLSLADSASSAILIERDSGAIMYEKNAHEQLPPASMTKMMTLLLIMEALDEEKITLDEKVRVSEHAASMGGSQIFLEEGEEMSVNDLLKGVAIASGNDASVALAERIAGTEEAFVQKMNDKAKALGLENTNFQNPTGLPAKNHYSTAYDMSVIAKELLKYGKITNYTSVYEDYLRKGTEDEFWLVNTNKLVKFYDGVDGLKTGYTSEAKYCLTATAKKDDMRVIAVAMGAQTPKERNKAVTNMLDYAFSQYKTASIYKKNQPVTQIAMIKADKDKVNVVTGDAVSILLKKGQDSSGIETTIKIDQDMDLPLEKGAKVGMLQVKQNGKVMTETPLLLEASLNKANVWKLFKYSMKEMVKNAN